MIKLTKILSELLNTFEVTALLSSDKKVSITEILDQIRALRKITTVRNVTPPEYMAQSSSEHTILILKFVTRGNAKQDLESIKNDILTQGKDRTDLRIPGVKSFKYKIDTLKRK
jgi:hypothetical protein